MPGLLGVHRHSGLALSRTVRTSVKVLSVCAVATTLSSIAGCSDDSPTSPPDATVIPLDASSGTDVTLTSDVSDASPTADYHLPPYNDPFACEPAAQPPPLDDGLDGSQTRAGVITQTSELIGGEGASGRVGHLKIYNNRVRFIVQNRTAPMGNARATGYDLFGGNIIDADLVRPTGEPGQDLFRETFPMVAFRVSNATEVTVVCDGSNGHPAAIRVIGRDVATGILGALDTIGRERDIRIVTHYILRPNTNVIELRTELQSNFGGPIPSSVAGDFLGFGNALTLFTDGTGFGGAGGAHTPQTWLAGASDPGENNRHVSYAIAPATGTITIPAVDASGTIGLYAPAVAPAGQPTSYTRYLSVGTGDITSAVEPLLQVRNDPYGTVTGTTTPNALVYAYRGAYTHGGIVRSMARSRPDGSFRLALSAGMYSLLAVDEGRVRGQPVTVTVTAGATATANPTAGPLGTLVLDLAIEGTTPTERLRTPVKVSLSGMGAEAPDPALGELEGERERFGLQRVIYSLTGQEHIKVKPGHYTAVVSRGSEFEVSRVEVTVPADGESTLTATLTRSVDTTGYIAADFHQHTVGSIDAPRSLCNRVIEDIAEGLEWAASTDHDNVSDFTPCIQQMSLQPWFNAMHGNELSVVGTGHFNAYPMPLGGSDPFHAIGAQYWAGLTVQALFDRIRSEPTDPILHLSHPRSTGLKGYFTSIALDPISLTGRQPLATGFVAIEVNTEVGDPAYYLASNDPAVHMSAMRDASSVPTLRDWFSLLNRGEHTCALGNSDTHGRNDGSGYPHNLLRVNEDHPDRVTIDSLRDAIRSQRVIVATGMAVKIRVNGVERMGHTEVVTPTAGMVDLELEVQAPTWVEARDLTLYENGRPLVLTPVTGSTDVFDARLATSPSDTLSLSLGPSSPGLHGAVRFRAHVRVHPTRDSYYVAVTRGGPLAPVGPGNGLSYTNPVYVDFDGAGWRAPQP